MTQPPYNRYAAPRRAAAAIVVAIALVAGVALIATSGGGGRRRVNATPARARATTPAATARYPDTPAGAVAAATDWGQTVTMAGIDGTWSAAVRPLATVAFWARLAPVQQASTLLHSRITSLHTPFAARRWPLGYAVENYSPATAKVRVWELATLGIAGPFDMTVYDTRTISLLWSDGNWKVASVSRDPDLTPPGANASAGQVASWVTAVDQFKSYTYGP